MSGAVRTVSRLVDPLGIVENVVSPEKPPKPPPVVPMPDEQAIETARRRQLQRRRSGRASTIFSEPMDSTLG